MKNQNTNAVSTPAIETRIASNGAVSVYVNGKRTSNEKAIEIAEQNGLPTYNASYLSYSGRSNNKDFATAIAAYAWLKSKINSSNNIADGSQRIKRVAADQTFIDGTTIYTNNSHGEKVADDEPELKLHIDNVEALDHINFQYRQLASKAAEEISETETASDVEIIARDENGEVEKIKSGNYIYKIRNTEYSRGVEHYWELNHEVAGLDEGDVIAIARESRGAEFQAELINYLEGKMVEDYAVTIEAQDAAVISEQANAFRAQVAAYIEAEDARERREKVIAFEKQLVEDGVVPADKAIYYHAENEPAANTATEIDEDEAAEKFYRETAATYRKMQSAIAPVREFLFNHIFDIYHFDYVLKVNDQNGKLQANPNKFHLVDYRFDAEVDRDNLEYVIYFWRTPLARYRKIDDVTHAVDMLAIAIANREPEFTFPPATPDENTPVDAAIETLDDDMKDEVRADIEPYKAEYNAAIKDVYLDDLSGGYDENAEIIPAADLLQFVIPLALTDHSSTAYRKNPDGTFTEDKIAFARLTEVETKIFNAAGHKIGIDNPEPEPPATPNEPPNDSKVAEHLNANAPEGWAVTVAKDKLRVDYQGKHVADVERITDRDLLAPHAFFQQFQPLVDKSKTPAQMFLDDRYRELAELEEMREELQSMTPISKERLKTLDEMINQVKRDIAEEELSPADTIESFCKSGAIDENGNIWF